MKTTAQALFKEINTQALAGKTIDPNKVNEFLGLVEKDGKYSDAEKRQVAQLLELSDSFGEKTASEMLASALRMAEGKFTVTSPYPGIEVSLSEAGREESPPRVMYRDLKVQFSLPNNQAPKDGKLEFEYGSQKLSIQIKKGMADKTIVNQILDKLLTESRQGSAIGTDAGMFGSQDRKVFFRVTNL